MLLKAKQIATMQRPAKRDWRSVSYWIVNDAPLVDDEQRFITREEDMITLRSGLEGANFEYAVERMLWLTDRFLTKYLRFGSSVVEVLEPIEVVNGRI